MLIFFVLLCLLPLSGYSKSRYEINADSMLITLAQEIMHQQVGTLERTNRNDGEVARYLKPFGLPTGSPYCAAGIYWAYLSAADLLMMKYSSIPIPKTGLANAIVNYAKKYGNRIEYSANIFDLIVWNKASTPFGHIEVIDSIARGGNIITIGFNTSKFIDNKLKEGVFYQKRNIYNRLTE